MFSRIGHTKHNRLTEQRIIEDVEKFGWHILLFEESKSEPSFAYTIGLWETFKHPEIISFGMTTQTLHGILNNAGQKIKNGHTLELYQDDNEIFETIPAQFLPVDPDNISYFFGYGLWFYKYQEFPALQLVWADREGKYPWQSEFDIEFDYKQPILNNQYRQKTKTTRS